MCLFFKFLFWLFPFRGFRAAILRYHIDRCSRCQEEDDNEELTKDILAVPDWIKAEPSLWPQVKHKTVLQEDEKTRKRKRSFFTTKWKWTAAALFLALAVVFIILYQQNDVNDSALEEAATSQKIPQVTIKHAELNGKKATSYVYQTPKISFIWFSETEKNED